MDINVTRPVRVSLLLYVLCNLTLTREYIQDSLSYTSSGDDNKMEADIRELMCYLWDNYLQLYNAEKIFIIGIGYAYIGIKMLLLNRSDASPPGKSSTVDIHSCPGTLSVRVTISALPFLLYRPHPLT